MIHRALIDLVLAAYSAGRNDGRREAWHQQQPRTDAPITMERSHGGDADDLNDL